METETKITGLCSIDKSEVPCQGVIRIIGKDKWTVGVSWRMFFENGMLIAFEHGTRFRFDFDLVTNSEVIRKTIERIQKYRISRK